LLNLLVSIDTSAEAVIALKTAAFFGKGVVIQPIYVYEPPGRDIEFGAGWARHSWEKETYKLAQVTIEKLILTQQKKYPTIKKPMLLKGNPVTRIADFFNKKKFDFLVASSFLKMSNTIECIQCFQNTARKDKNSIPLLIINKINDFKKIIILTDGGETAEKAIGLLLKLPSLLYSKIILIGLARANDDSEKIQFLNLERGRAILKEKNFGAEGYIFSKLGLKGLKEKLRGEGVLVCPVLSSDGHLDLSKIITRKNQSGIFCIEP